VQREELDARRQQLRQIQEFVDAGSRPISALYEQEAAVAEQESAVFSAQRDVQLAETRLIQTLQLEPMGRYRFEAPSIGNDSLAVADYDLQRLLV
jgi:outer membrane protein